MNIPWNKGKTNIYSKETIEKMRIAKLGKPSGRKGKTLTIEWRKKLSDAHMGKTLSDEHKNNIGLAHTGMKRSKETCIKISIAKKSKLLKGSKSNMWNGGKIITPDGYIRIYSPYHPHSASNYVFEHRLVMEKHIGRFLKSTEIVHHKGIKYHIKSKENKGDNRIVNLELFQSVGKHLNYHKKLNCL